MAGVGMAHKLLKNNTDLWQSHTSQLKLFTSSPQGQASKPCPCPNPRSLYFGLKLINCLCRDSFGCKSIPSCNCPGGKRKISIHPCMHLDGDTERGGIWYSCSLYWPQTGTYSCQWWSDYSYKVKEACCLRSWSSGHWRSSSISPTRLWLRRQAAVLWTFSILLISVWWWGLLDQLSSMYRWIIRTLLWIYRLLD